jgi:hypothetical protein
MGAILRDNTKDPRAPKYSYDKIELTSPFESLSKNDKKTLARLVKKYGREVMVGAVTLSPEARPRGRPSREDALFLEAAHYAGWFEDEVEEHRERGSKHPIRDAEIALYEMETGREPDDRFERWRLNAKKKRLRGARNLKLIRQAAEARSRYLASLKGRK